MSNRRRKAIGQTKIKRNRLIRIARACRRTGDEWPGDGRIYNPDNMVDEWNMSTELRVAGAKLREDMQNLVVPYWRGTAR